MREFRRQTDSVRNVVEREFYKMDQDVTATETPQLQAAPGVVAQGAPDALPTATDAMPSQLTAPMDAAPAVPIDESNPAHPDYYRVDQQAADAFHASEGAPANSDPAPPAPVAPPAAAPVAAAVAEDTSKAKVG